MANLLTIAEYSAKYGTSQRALAKRCQRGQVPGAVKSQAGRWQIPDNPATTPEDYRGLPEYEQMNLEQLKVLELALRCREKAMMLREREGTLIAIGDHMDVITAASTAASAALDRFPRNEADKLARICPQLPAVETIEILTHAVHEIRDTFLKQLSAAIEG